MKKSGSLSMALLAVIMLLTTSVAHATTSRNNVTIKMHASHTLWYLRTNWSAQHTGYSPLKKRDFGGLGKIVVSVGSKNVCQGNYSGDIWADTNYGTPAFIFWNCPDGMTDERYFYPGDLIMVEIMSGLPHYTAVQKVLTQADIDAYLIYISVPEY